MPGVDSPTLLLDFGFSANLAQASSAGRTISRLEQAVAQSSVVIYSVQDGPFESTQVQGYAEAIVDGERRAGFDPKTGQMIFLERLVVRANGDRQIAERVDLLTAERVAAPLLKYLSC
jgi:hypothetical protein